jgi:lipoprotein NlpD
MVEKRLNRTARASLLGVWIALAVGGCANVAQQDAGNNAAAVSNASAIAAAIPAAPVVATSAPLKAGTDAGATLAKSPPLVYRVKRGDTLARIAQRHRCSVRQLQAWNGLKPSSHLKNGQVLHVASPETVRAVNAANAAAVAAKAASAQTSVANQATQATQAQGGQAAQSAAAPLAGAAPLDAPDAREVAQQTRRHADGVSLAWPAGGRIVEAFQPGETRGIEIGGKPGDPVRAAADGKVMYAGTGLNSYGSLIIVQHNKDFLTAYSHNRKLLVRTGDIVRQGQQIAEMGDENNSRVSVGFELRHDGKPVDPVPYLPQGRG